jgi:glycine/D-amino acid oxidase-like deaminating enzyme
MPRSGPVYWLAEAMAAEEPLACPPLTGTETADVCIVGGGYTGLWTALEIRRLAPDAKVTLLESGACGFGASGRNGGWATSWYDELDRLVERFGEQQGLWLADQSSASVARIGQFAEQEGFDCHFRPEGSLWLSTSAQQDEVIAAPLRECRRLGRGELVEQVGRDAAIERSGAAVARSAVLLRDSAAVQPALLARGLRRAAMRAGVRIHEGSRVLRIERTRPAAVATSSGRVEAGQLVLAMNAWAAQIRELRRAIFVVGTQMVITEPVEARRVPSAFGAGMLVGDARMFVHYSQMTRDGRLVFGRGGGAIGSAGRVVPKHFIDQRTADVVARDLCEWFPELAGSTLTHAWGGAVDRAPGHLPFAGSLGDHENVHYAVGYSGNGVAPSVLLGRILARRALGITDALSRCALVSGPPAYMPPEPLRFPAAVAVRSIVNRAERREERGQRAGLAGRAGRRLAGFATPPVRSVVSRLLGRSGAPHGP